MTDPDPDSAASTVVVFNQQETIHDEEEQVPQIEGVAHQNIYSTKNQIDMSQVVTKLRQKNSSSKISQWQLKLIELCMNINDCMKPGIERLECIAEELTFKVVECKSGHSDNLIGAWLMAIRLTIGKIHFPPGNNNTNVASECWEKLSALAQIGICTLERHKKIFKPILKQLELVHEKYVKYVDMVGRPLPPLSLYTRSTEIVKDNTDGHVIPDRFVPGGCSASVAILERDVILVHDQNKDAPIILIKESPGNYSPCIEILKLFIEQTTGMMLRSYETMIASEKTIDPIGEFTRIQMSELLALLLKYNQAHRLQEKCCSFALKSAMKSLNDTIKLFVDHVEAIKLICIWVLTAVEACFDKIKESWPNVDFQNELNFRNEYRTLLPLKQNPWWLPKRIFGSKKFTFWDDISENIGKFEKCFRRWGVDDMHLINLRVSIPNELATLLFVETDPLPVDHYFDSQDEEEETAQELESFYSDIFIIEVPQDPPPSKGRRHLSHVNTSVEDIELDLDNHASHPVLDHNELFVCKNKRIPTDATSAATKSNISSLLPSTTYSILSPKPNDIVVVSSSYSSVVSNRSGDDSVEINENTSTKSKNKSSAKHKMIMRTYQEDK